jgi:radical SAM superfamily enzyme YgiQ (UPF0313 family)
MKAVLIIPQRPYLFDQKSFPYIGVLMVSAALKAEEYETEVLDFADGYKYVEADWYGIFATSSDWDEVLVVKEFILKNNPIANIMVGGPHATYNTKQCADHFDYISVGAVDIINYGEEQAKPYVSFGHKKNIDMYHHPDHEALDLWDYTFFVDSKRATSMITALSCPYGKCKFCSRPPGIFNRPRYHSSKWCIEEIKRIEELGFKALMLYDDEFFTYPTRDTKIVDYLKKSKIESWRCFARADYSLKHPKLIEKASKSGLKEVLIGIESGSPIILDVIDKGTTPEQNLKAVKMFSKLGISVKCAMIMGLPSESLDTLRDTWRWCENIEPFVSDWDFTTYVPLPGSEIYNNPDKFDLEFNKDDTLSPYKAMNMDSKICPISTSELTFDEIQDARDFFESRFKHGEGLGDLIFLGDD